MEIVLKIMGTEVFQSIVEILKVLPGILLTLFSLYFAYRKIFYKVSVYYSINMNRISEDRISDIVLINNKDRPVILTEIIGVINKKYSVSIHKFDTPKVLKPLESLHVDTTPVSKYETYTKDKIELFSLHSKIDLYICTSNKPLKLQHISSPEYSAYRKFKKLNKVMISRREHNGIVYNENVRWFLIYSTDGVTTRTAYIEDKGFIGGDWNRFPNFLQNIEINNKKAVEEFFNKQEIRDSIVSLSIVSPK